MHTDHLWKSQLNIPAVQLAQSDSSTLPDALENVPEGQGVGVAEPCTQYLPGGHIVS